MNSIKTAVLMAGLAGLLIVLGWRFGGMNGAVVAFAVAMALNLVSYWFSDRIVLSMYGAKEVPGDKNPELHDVVRELAAHAGIPKPRVYMIPADVPNAFATGRDPAHSAVAVTEGLVRLLTREELKGVLGHEISHIKHRDVLISTIAATVATAITMLATMIRWAAIAGGVGGRDRDRGGIEVLVLAILAPVAAFVIQMAMSRSREYAADEGGARLSGHPTGLADALVKLARRNDASAGIASPATAHLFIVSSLGARSFASLFSTHPPLEERVRRLRRMVAVG